MFMGSTEWDFNFGGAGFDAMTSIDTNDSANGNGTTECGANTDHVVLSGSFPIASSSFQTNGVTSVQGGLQGLDIKDLVGQRHTTPTMHFSSNHFFDAVKWFHQKRLQSALASSKAHTLSAAHLYIDNHQYVPSQGTSEPAKLSLQRICEGAAGSTTESLLAGSNGSKTSSPDSLSSSLNASSPYFNCFPCGKEQTEHNNLLSKARPEFHDGILDSLQMSQLRDAMWHSYPQVSHGVILPSLPSGNGVNQPQVSCEGASTKTKPRVRARRGQATDPHSIAERLRRERIADRIKLLQELVPNTNKTDRAIMLDEIIEYVKFLLLQVKLLSTSRLGSAALILPIAAGLSEDKGVQTPAEIIEGEGLPLPEDSMSAIEEHVAGLITTNVGAALRFLQRKGLCLVPIFLTDTTKTTVDASLSPVKLPNSSIVRTVT